MASSSERRLKPEASADFKELKTRFKALRFSPSVLLSLGHKRGLQCFGSCTPEKRACSSPSCSLTALSRAGSTCEEPTKARGAAADGAEMRRQSWAEADAFPGLA